MRVRGLLARARGWLGEAPASNRDAVLTGFASALVLAALGTLVGYLLDLSSVIDFDGEIPTWLVLVFGGIGLMSGVLIGSLAMGPLYYGPRLQTLELLEAAARRDVNELRPYRDTITRVGIYTEHLDSVFDNLSDGPIENLDRALLGMPRETMRKAAQIDVYLSVWRLGRSRIPGVRDKLEVDIAPDHTESERQSFEVRADRSWITWAGSQQTRSERLLGINDLDLVAQGDDLKAFREHNFRSLRCATVQNSHTQAHLVVLAKEPDAFSEVEERYILLLRAALSVAMHLHELESLRSDSRAD
jgi:hypothetical protein